MGLALEAGMFRPAVIRGYVEKIVHYISAATFLIQYRQNYIKKAYPASSLSFRMLNVDAWGRYSSYEQTSCRKSMGTMKKSRWRLDHCATEGLATFDSKLASTWWPQGCH